MKNIDEIKESISHFSNAIVKIPSEKITNINEKSENRMEDFCVFILSYGRSDNVKTYKTLMEYDNAIFNQDFYIVCSDDDKDLDNYLEKFGDRVIIFNKEKMIPYLDKGDNFEKINVILYARNICFTLAEKMGYKYFVELDDDYDIFTQRIFYDNKRLIQVNLFDLDTMFKVHLDFLKNTENTKVKTITMSQHGDFIGGVDNMSAQRGFQRKVMNSFFCDINKPFLFDGSINEDVNYYTQSGIRGELNFNLFGFSLHQEKTQKSSGGMTETYLDGGTYLKSFYTILYSPSCTKIASIGQGVNKRIHHRISTNNAYPKILDEKYSKFTYDELHKKESILDDF